MFMAAKLLPSLLTLYKRNLQTRFVLTKSANLSNKEPLIKNLKVKTWCDVSQLNSKIKFIYEALHGNVVWLYFGQ